LLLGVCEHPQRVLTRDQLLDLSRGGFARRLRPAVSMSRSAGCAISCESRSKNPALDSHCSQRRLHLRTKGNARDEGHCLARATPSPHVLPGRLLWPWLPPWCWCVCSFVFGGIWANEPLDHSALRERVGDAVRMIEAAPPDLAARLAARQRQPGIAVQWYDATSDVATTLRRDSGLVKRSKSLQTSLLGDLRRTALVFEPARAMAPPPQLTAISRNLVPRISWLFSSRMPVGWFCSVPNRNLGSSRAATLGCLLADISCPYRLRQSAPLPPATWFGPSRQLAAAVRRFWRQSQAPALAEAGPHEFRDVIAAFNTMQAQIQKFVGIPHHDAGGPSRTICARLLNPCTFAWRADRRRDAAGEIIPGC